MFQFPVTPVRQLPRDARATRDRRARRRSGRVARRGRALGRATLNGALLERLSENTFRAFHDAS